MRALMVGAACAVLALSSGAKAQGASELSGEPATAEASEILLTFDYATQDLEWRLYSAVLLTGTTGARVTVLLGAEQLDVRQVEKDDACAKVIVEFWQNGRPAPDDRGTSAFLVCPLSSAPSELEGEKFLMKVQETDIGFTPTHRPIGMSVDIAPSKKTRSILQMKAVAMFNDDGSANGRETFTLWRDIGSRYVLADMLFPKGAK